jgi:predicted deacetylase
MSTFVAPRYRLAADAFEAMVENAIVRVEDLYDLDGETMFRNRGGCIETCDAELGWQDDWQ